MFLDRKTPQSIRKHTHLRCKNHVQLTFELN